MKKCDEIVQKMHNHYITDSYIQIMLGYRNYLVLFGNNDLMYYKNFIKKPPSLGSGMKNVYLNDERRNAFPYSQIPEHIERVSLFRKMNFANQILDFEKPYIRITDGLIAKLIAFKDGDEAIVYTKILNGKLYNYRTKTITRKDLEKYLQTGSLEQFAEEEYANTTIFDLNGSLYYPMLESEQSLIEDEKERLSRIINKSEEYSERTKAELLRAISLLDAIAPFYIITKKFMIKFKANGEIKVEAFAIEYLAEDKYEIKMADLPVTMESLAMLKSKLELPKIKTLKEPKISLLLNPNVTKEQLQKEKAKILMRTK